jgi:hypothetical protein
MKNEKIITTEGEDVETYEIGEESDGLDDILGNAQDLEPDEEEDDDDEQPDDDDEEPEEAEPYEPNAANETKGEPIDNDIIFSGISLLSDMVTNICVSISDDKDNKRYIKTETEKTKFSNKLSKFFNQQGYTMSPTTGIIIAAFMFFGMPIGYAMVRRGKNRKVKLEAEKREAAIAAANEQRPQETFVANIGTPPVVPTACREAQQKRKNFDIYKSSGCYKLPPDTADAKNALGIDNATEQPSPTVAPLIAKGMSNEAIREYLGY